MPLVNSTEHPYLEWRYLYLSKQRNRVFEWPKVTRNGSSFGAPPFFSTLVYPSKLSVPLRAKSTCQRSTPTKKRVLCLAKRSGTSGVVLARKAPLIMHTFTGTTRTSRSSQSYKYVICTSRIIRKMHLTPVLIVPDGPRCSSRTRREGPAFPEVLRPPNASGAQLRSAMVQNTALVHPTADHPPPPLALLQTGPALLPQLGRAAAAVMGISPRVTGELVVLDRLPAMLISTGRTSLHHASLQPLGHSIGEEAVSSSSMSRNSSSNFGRVRVCCYFRHASRTRTSPWVKERQEALLRGTALGPASDGWHMVIVLGLSLVVKIRLVRRNSRRTL